MIASTMHGVIGMMEREQLVALVGEGGAGLLEVARDLLGAVVDVAGGDQLVARVVEGVEGGIELVPVLRVHVLATIASRLRRIAAVGRPSDARLAVRRLAIDAASC